MDEFLKNIADREWINHIGLDTPVLVNHKESDKVTYRQMALLANMGNEFDKYSDDILALCTAYEYQGFVNGFATAAKLIGKEDVDNE